MAVMGKPSKKMQRCLKTVTDNIQKELKGKNKREKSLFMREFLKGVIDSDCSNMILQLIPEKQLTQSLDEIQKHVEHKENPFEFLYPKKRNPSSKKKSPISDQVCECLELKKDIDLEKSIGTDSVKIVKLYGKQDQICKELFNTTDPKQLKILIKSCQ